MSDIISKAKVQYDVEKHRGILSAQGFYAESNVLEHLLKKIESGAFDVAVDVDVAEIEGALEKATPGEWERKKGMTVCDVLSPSAKSYIARVTSERNAHLITNAPTWLRQLLAKLAEKDAEIERLRKQLSQALEALEWIRDAGTDYQSISKARQAIQSIQSIRGGDAQ